MPTPVIIVDYDRTWPACFESFRLELLQACGSLIEHVEHVGSTSVPGLAAKNIIDIMIGVADASLLDVSAEAEAVLKPGEGPTVMPAGSHRHVQLVNAVNDLAYEYRGEYTIPGRLYWNRPGADGPGSHIHMVRTGSQFWIDHLAFRDYLRANPAKSTEYAALKR